MRIEDGSFDEGVGFDEGRLVGWEVGKQFCLYDGEPEGCDVGVLVGRLVGDALEIEGKAERWKKGSAVGTTEGVNERSFEGEIEGTIEGSILGLGVCNSDGWDEG